MSSADLELRLGYLDLGPADLERLAALQPVLEKHATGLVDSFYHHLLSFSPTRRLLVDPGVRE
ncbi:MAG TPA: protoglobin domain-containing protein, partial [Myxococcota bacterium]